MHCDAAVDFPTIVFSSPKLFILDSLTKQFHVSFITLEISQLPMTALLLGCEHRPAKNNGRAQEAWVAKVTR